jgi:replication factor C large subunit
MGASWTEKYRPTTLGDVVGNSKSIGELKSWADSWDNGRPKRYPAVILAGEAGTGKTSAALALAKDKKWAVIELNASDARNYTNISKVVTMGVIHETFSDDGTFVGSDIGGRKLVILDEADNLYESSAGSSKRKGSEDKETKDMSDRGGKKAIIEALAQACQPIILIVNDLYSLTKGRGEAIKRYCKIIRFEPLRKDEIRNALKQVVISENVGVEEKVLDVVADKSGGDLRAALNDLEGLAIGRKTLSLKEIDTLGFRDPSVKIYGALNTIFRTKSLTMAKEAVGSLDETPQDLLVWIDENLPKQYTRTQDIIDSLEYLSKADILLRRVYRRQHFALWSYARELMSAGVALSKRDIYEYSPKNDFPMYLIAMSRSKMDRALQEKVLQKLRNYFHCSTQGARDMQLTIRELIKKDKRMATRLVIAMQLDESELGYIAESTDYASRVFDETESHKKGDDEKDEIEAFEDKKEPVEKAKPVEKEPEPKKKDDDKGKKDPQGASQSSLIDFGR